MAASLDTRPVVLLVTANDCGACSKFYTPWSTDISPAISNLGNVRLEWYAYPTMGSMPTTINGKAVPVDLANYVGWFPTLLLVPGTAWNNSMRDKDAPLNAEIFALDTYVNGVPTRSKTIPLTKEAILRWIKDTVPKMTAHESKGETKSVVNRDLPARGEDRPENKTSDLFAPGKLRDVPSGTSETPVTMPGGRLIAHAGPSAFSACSSMNIVPARRR